MRIIEKLVTLESINKLTILCTPLLLIFFNIVPIFVITSPQYFKSYDYELILLTLIALIPWVICFHFRELLNLKKCYFSDYQIPTKFFKACEIVSWVSVILSLSYLAFTSGGVPLIEGARGMEYRELATLRMKFDLDRSGISLLAVYINIIVTNVCFPLLTLNSFIKNHNSKWIKLIFTNLLSVAGLAKLSFMKIVLPVLFFFLIKKYYKSLFLLISYTIVFFFIIQFIAQARVNEILHPRTVPLVEVRENPIQEAKQNTNDNYIFGNATGFGAIVNRILWIPYITARRWLEYSDEFNLKEKQPVISNRTIAYILHAEYIPLESNIMIYQYGAPTGTFIGSANTGYIIDSWVKLGIIGYSLVILMVPLLYTFMFINYPIEYRGLLLFSLLFFTSGGLINYLLSGGIFLFILTFFIKLKKNSLPESPPEPHPQS